MSTVDETLCFMIIRPDDLATVASPPTNKTIALQCLERLGIRCRPSDLNVQAGAISRSGRPTFRLALSGAVNGELIAQWDLDIEHRLNFRAGEIVTTHEHLGPGSADDSVSSVRPRSPQSRAALVASLRERFVNGPRLDGELNPLTHDRPIVSRRASPQRRQPVSDTIGSPTPTPRRLTIPPLVNSQPPPLPTPEEEDYGRPFRSIDM